MRVSRTVPFLIVSLTVLAGFVVMLSSLLAANSVRSQSQSPAMASSESMSDDRTHVLHGGFWRTDGGFVSTIRIKNVLVVAPIQVSPTIFMADGTAYPLAPVTVPIAGVVTVNINDALASAPRAVAPHISQFGSLALIYNYPTPGHLVATLAAIDAPRSLSFVYMINEPMPMPEDNTLKVLEGLWWKHDRAVHGTISLSNTTDQPRTATLRVIRNSKDSDVREVPLAPHTTEVLSLEQFSREASDQDNRAGGLRVEYNGPSGAIMVTGSLANESVGYSANMPIWSHDATNADAQKINIGSAGIMVGKPDPMMMPGFPAGTRFIPYLSMRNTTAAPLDVRVLLNYMTGSTPVNRNLPPLRLRPFEARKVELEPALHAAGLKDFDGNVNLSFSYTGHGGDLILATGSVDQTSTYVFEVRPEGIGERIGTISGSWSVANGDDSMFSLWNPTDAPQDVIATFYYGDGSGTYHLPVHLAPQASTMLDVAMLIMEKTRDVNGNIIPSNIRDGSVSFDSAGHDSNTPDGKKRTTVVIAGGFYNVANATCGMHCTYCNGYSNWALNPSSATIPVGGSSGFIAQAIDSYGTLTTLYGGIWGTSDNGSISTVDSQGNVTGRGPGSTFVSDLLQNIIVYQGNYCVSDSMPDICPTGSPAPAASVTVTPAISGPNTVWYFGGQNPSGYSTSITLTSSGGAGTTWSVTAGSSLVNLSTTSGSQTTITSTGSTFSASTGDITIRATTNGVNSPTFQITSRAPNTLAADTVTTTCDATYGYQTLAGYTVKDNLLSALPGVIGVNEAWTTDIQTDYSGANWRRQTVGGGSPTNSNAAFSDVMQGEASGFIPTADCNGTNTAVQHWGQDWRVGSQTSGSGRRVQSDTLQKYINHAAHNNIVTPNP